MFLSIFLKSILIFVTLAFIFNYSDWKMRCIFFRITLPANSRTQEILNIIIVILMLCFIKSRRKIRRWWVRPFLRHRDTLGFGATVFHHIIDDDPELFKSFTRLSVDQFNYILGLVHLKLLKRSRRKALLEKERLLITLK